MSAPGGWGYDPTRDDGIEPESDDRYYDDREQDAEAADAAWGRDR